MIEVYLFMTNIYAHRHRMKCDQLRLHSFVMYPYESGAYPKSEGAGCKSFLLTCRQAFNFPYGSPMRRNSVIQVSDFGESQ